MPPIELMPPTHHFKNFPKSSALALVKPLINIFTDQNARLFSSYLSKCFNCDLGHIKRTSFSCLNQNHRRIFRIAIGQSSEHESLMPTKYIFWIRV